MCGAYVWKIGQWNIKTKIYWTIKGLIILFIKLQFSNQMQQAYRLLHTLTSNLNLKLSLNPNGFVICIIFNAFILSPIYLIHNFRPSLHKQRSLYIQSSLVQAYILVKPGGHWSIHQKTFVILVNVLTNKADICTREKS